MTILNQLYMMVVGIFVVLFAGSVAVDDQAMQSTYHAQLRQVAQQMAHRAAVGSSGEAALSAVEAAALAGALLDSGPYYDITVIDRTGKILAHRDRSITPTDLPFWFIALHDKTSIELPLGDRKTITVIAAVDAHQSATLAWDRDSKLLVWFAAMCVTALWLIRLIVTRCLQPLQQVVVQADALSRRDYPIQDALPATPQLRHVVVALNRLSAALRKIIDAQMQAMNRLRDDAYRDSVTGLANRRFFELHLEQLLTAADEFDSGALIQIGMRMPASTRDHHARAHSDGLITQTAMMIKEMTLLDAGHDYFVARLSDTTFAVSVTPASEREALAFGARLSAGLQHGYRQVSEGDHDAGHIGVVLYRRQSATQWLAESDAALRTAQSEGPNAQHLYPSKEGAVATVPMARLTDFLHSIIDQKNLILHLQPVLASANRLTLLQYEVLLRAVGEDGQLLNAAHFVPTAKRLGLMPQIDRLVVTEVVSRLRQQRYGTIRVAVNLSPASISNHDFVDWLCMTLNDDPEAACRIAFEVVEIGVLDRLDAVRQMIDKLRQTGAQFGIDRVGRGFVSFDYLSSLTLDYLKIDGCFIRGIQHQRDNQLLVDSICKMAHGLDVIVIAESVETDEESDFLGGLLIDGVQGYGVGMPAEI